MCNTLELSGFFSARGDLLSFSVPGGWGGGVGREKIGGLQFGRGGGESVPRLTLCISLNLLIICKKCWRVGLVQEEAA